MNGVFTLVLWHASKHSKEIILQKFQVGVTRYVVVNKEKYLIFIN